MNNRNNRPYERHESLGEELKLREDLEALHRLPVPSMHFDPQAARIQSGAMTKQRRWRPAFVAAATIAGLALFAGGSSLFGGSPSEVSAQELFEKTHALAAMQSPVSSSVSYHMVARNQSFGPPGMQVATTNSTTETWYEDAQHQRYETRDDAGRLVFGNAQDGDDLWFYSSLPGDDDLRVVHSTEATTGFMAFGAQDFGADDLAGLLEMYSGSCANAEKVGEETVAGRPTYVIEVTQTPETCDIKPVITTEGDFTSVKVEAPDGVGTGVSVAVGSVNVKPIASAPAVTTAPGEAASPEMTFRIIETTTRMWVDQETFITLRTETEAEDGLLFRYEVTEFEVDPDFDPSTFAYEPPAGTEVVEADGPEDIKVVLSGGVAGSFSGGNFQAGPSTEEVKEGATER